MLYEFATLSFHPNDTRKAVAGAQAYVTAAEARGGHLASVGHRFCSPAPTK